MDDNAIKDFGREEGMSALGSWRVRTNPSDLCHSTLSSKSAASKVHFLPDAPEKVAKKPHFKHRECLRSPA